jgi:hypothetical protein
MLHGYLDKMFEITDQVHSHLSARAPSGVAELARARAEQARTITSYQLYVHREIFDPMMRSGTVEQVAKAREMKVECIMLAEDFRAFARRWQIDNVLSEWDAYRPAALDLRDRVRGHITNMRRASLFLPVESAARTGRSRF